MDDSFAIGPNVGPRRTLRYDGAHMENEAEANG